MKAFPITSKWEENNGMDLRDYFAAKAMQAILSTPSQIDSGSASLVSRASYEYADAMMKARK